MANSASSPNAFWSSPVNEPKRSYKYLVKWGDGDIPWYFVSAIDLPQIEVSQAETHALNHTFKWTGRPTWQDITMEVTDSESLNAMKVIIDKFKASGYVYPNRPTQLGTMSKQAFVREFGQLVVKEIDWSEHIIGEWKFQNAWIKSIDPGKKAYESDETQKISMSVVFDWAEYTTELAGTYIGEGSDSHPWTVR